MFRNYLKVAFRNLWKNKGYSLINIGGLAIGLAGFIILLVYLNNEHSYDSWSPQLENIYKVNQKKDLSSSDEHNIWNDNCDTRIAPMLRSSLPGTKSVTVVSGSYDYSFSAAADGKTFLENMNLFHDSDSSFFQVFPYAFLSGNRDHALDKVNSMVITDSTAIKWFGSVQALGRSVTLRLWRDDPGKVYEITGVVKGMNAPTSIRFNGIFHSGQADKISSNPQETYSADIYVRLDAPRSDSMLAKQVNTIYTASFAGLLKQRSSSLREYTKSGRQYGIRLMPLQKVHLYPLNGKSVMDKLAPVLALSILLLLIAVINFANLSTAQVIGRAKEAGLRKVIGANKRSLVLQFFLQAAIQCLLALIIALFMVELFLPFFNQIFDSNLSLWFYHHSVKRIWWQLILILSGTILLSGVYPAFFMASFDPVKVLKGNFSTGIQGTRVRNALVIVQFLIAAGFIVGIGVIQKQVNYMAHADLGFQPSGLINLNTNYDQKLCDRLRAVPGVADVGTTNQVMGNAFNVMHTIKYNGEPLNMNIASVNLETLKAMKVDLLAGRLFDRDHGQDSINNIVINESAARLLGGHALGKMIYENDSLQKQVIGVIADYHYEGFDSKVQPTIYSDIKAPGPKAFTNNLLVRIDAGHFSTAIAGIKSVWNNLYPEFPLHYTFLDESFHKVIADNLRFRKIVSVFTLLSLILSLVGIFTLSAFMTTSRTKEIGIRKVLGASLADILKLLNRNFIIMAVIANIIAWPVAYVFIQKWLDGFAYRIEMPFMPFVTAMILSVALTILVVSIQAWRAAKANPVEALKYE